MYHISYTNTLPSYMISNLVPWLSLFLYHTIFYYTVDFSGNIDYYNYLRVFMSNNLHMIGQSKVKKIFQRCHLFNLTHFVRFNRNTFINTQSFHLDPSTSFSQPRIWIRAPSPLPFHFPCCSLCLVSQPCCLLGVWFVGIVQVVLNVQFFCCDPFRISAQHIALMTEWFRVQSLCSQVNQHVLRVKVNGNHF